EVRARVQFFATRREEDRAEGRVRRRQRVLNVEAEPLSREARTRRGDLEGLDVEAMRFQLPGAIAPRTAEIEEPRAARHAKRRENADVRRVILLGAAELPRQEQFERRL